MLWGMTKLGRVQKIAWKYGVEVVDVELWSTSDLQAVPKQSLGAVKM